MAKRQVSIFINGREVANQMKSLRSEKRKVVAELNRMTIGTKEYNQKAKELGKLNGIIDKHNSKLRGTASTWSKATKAGRGFLGIAAAAFTVDALATYGKELFKMGIEMEGLDRKAKIVFGEALPLVSQAAKQNASELGLTTSQYIALSAAMGDLLVPMGFTRKEAANISTELVNLSGALSEWTGGQVSSAEVSDILSKALLGEREQLKTLGIAISEADVKARLAEKGLSKLTGQMLQQAKAAATLELITEKSADAQTKFADNADSDARKLARLEAKMSSVAEKIATLLIPVFSKLLDIAGNVADFFTDVADGFESIADPATAAADAFAAQTDNVAALESEINPLLERYDALITNTNRSTEEQAELDKIIKQIGETLPGAITGIDDYGNVLSISANKARELVQAEKDLAQALNGDAIDKQADKIKELTRLLELNRKEYNTGKGDIIGFAGVASEVILSDGQLEARRKRIQELSTEIRQQTVLLRSLKGEALVDTVQPDIDPVQAAADKANKAAELREIAEAEADAKNEAKATERRAKAAEKEEAEYLKKLARLKEIAEAFSEDQRIAALSEDEQKLERLKARYQKEIDKAIELERDGHEEATTQRLELERLRDDALNTLKAELAAAAKAKADAEAAEQLEKETERARALELAKFNAFKKIQAEINSEFLSIQELEILRLEEHYQKLIALAQANGIETLGLVATFAKKKADINAKYEKEAQAKAAEANQERLAAYASQFAALGGIVSGVIAGIGEDSKEALALQKVLTLAQIGFSSAEAISKAVAASAGIPFPGNIGAIATAVGVVGANIAQARNIFKNTKVPQKRKGRWTEVVGQDDNRSYRAQYIGSQSTGMLDYNHPVLMNTATGPVLANEDSKEYFVNHTALKDPIVFDHVQAIDNIVKYRQFREGGSTVINAAPEGAPNTGFDSEVMNRLVSVLERQEQALSNLHARLDDDTILSIAQRQDELKKASGGYL